MKPELGVCYYPEHWDREIWAEDASRMKEMGLSWVRIGEFAWSRLEPTEGQFDWEWLDESVRILGEAGLKVVMGTPSATPPTWVIKKYPDMLPVDANGNTRKFGSRRHYCFSHMGYRQEAARMAGQMAQRYGKNPSVQAWQIDNEYDCHETTVSYSNVALAGFRDWLAQKYQSPEALNKAWGNVFWSMEYADFDEIELPNLTVTEPNPAHVMDFRRYASDQVVAFNKAQVQAVQAHTDQPLVHNYMGRTLAFDHFKVGDDLEIASWDSYPLGFLEDRSDEGEDWKRKFSQQGDPDFQAFHHDIYRAVGQRKSGGMGRWWVMEQQPGPVNWAPWNPVPLDGMVRLWSMEAIAHGAEVVSYFRWRQAPFAQEQMHAGLLRPDSVEARGAVEARQVAEDIAKLSDITHHEASVGIVFDYESAWAWETQPQGKDFDYFRLVFSYYKALRQLGFSVDILSPDTADFGDRDMVFIPGLLYWRDSLKDAIESFAGHVIVGPRTGSKTEDMSIPIPLPPNLASLDATISRVASIRPEHKIALANGGAVEHWFEYVDCEDGIIREKTDQLDPVILQKENEIYMAGWLNNEALKRVIKEISHEAGIDICEMPETLRRRHMDTKQVLLNYGAEEIEFDGITIPPADFAII